MPYTQLTIRALVPLHPFHATGPQRGARGAGYGRTACRRGVWGRGGAERDRGLFTIYLNKAVATSVGPIAWLVTEHP
jgi:hypothetical protein